MKLMVPSAANVPNVRTDADGSCARHEHIGGGLGGAAAASFSLKHKWAPVGQPKGSAATLAAFSQVNRQLGDGR